MPSSWPQLPTTPRKPAIQQYPTRTHLGKDVTPASGPIALDARLTDDDVIALLQTAYPETELEEIQGNDKIMEQNTSRACTMTATSFGATYFCSDVLGGPCCCCCCYTPPLGL